MAEWPDRPSLRFIVRQELRRDDLCDVALCHDSPGPEVRCGRCPLTRLEAAHYSPAGRILKRALHKKALVKMGILPDLDDLGADELLGMMIIVSFRHACMT